MNLEQLERFSAKVRRKHVTEDPISHLTFEEYDQLRTLQNEGHTFTVAEISSLLDVSPEQATEWVERFIRRELLVWRDQNASLELTEQASELLSNGSKVYALMALEMTDRMSDEEAVFLDTLLHKY